MTDAFTQLSAQVPDGFGALLAKSNEAAKPELEKQQAAEEEFAKQKGDVMVAKAKEIAKTKQAGIGGEMAVYKKYDKELMSPPPTIQYSSDTAEGMQSLAVLLPLAGAMMGGSGLLSGIGAMNAMSGVLEGHRQGNQDRIALEQKNFEQKMNEWKIHMEQVKGAFDRALQMAKLNASGAQAQLEAKLAELDAPLLLADVKRNGISNAAQRNLNTIDKMTTMIEQSQAKMYAGNPLKVTRDGKEYYVDRAGNVIGEVAAPASARKDPGQRALVVDTLGQDLGADSGNAVQIASSMAEAASMAKYVNENKDVVGRSGQFNEFVNRYIDSFRTGDTSAIDAQAQKADPETQKALLFAKRYAKFLTDYERSVAGGARGFTVNLQQRYNQLMSSGQFTPESFVQLMREHSKEIASGATALGKGITYDNLMNLGSDVRGRAGDTSVNEAIDFLKQKSATSSAAPSEKIAKQSDIEFTAKKRGLSIEETKKQLRALGYKIEGE